MIGMKSWADFITTAPNPAADIQDGHRTGQPAQSQPKITLNPQLFISLLKFVQRTVLDPQALHTTLNPAPVVPPLVLSPQQSHKGVPQGKNAPQGRGVAQGKKGGPTPQSQQKKSGRYVPPSSDSSSSAPTSLSEQMAGDSLGEENDSERAGRLRVGALGVVGWILGTLYLLRFGSR